MAPKAAARATGARLLSAFRAAGAVEVETDILQPAGALLDLYGEDIRARAYVTSDPLSGEMMMRPDFTVPVVQAHMADGAEPARYCYFGEVFRAQDHRGARAREYFQAGYEVFDRADPEAADAEVFELFARLLAPFGLDAAMGDIGLLMDAVRGLDTLPARRAALLRAIWRPARFAALLARYAAPPAPSPARAALLAGQAPPRAHWVGLRSAADMAARLVALRQDAAAPPIAAADVAALARLFAVSAPAPQALAELRAIASGMPAIGPAVARLEQRIAALAAHGVDLARVTYQASHGLGTMEYYDGFVFSFTVPAHPDLPPVASGGRYDALTAVLGQGRSIPAVGGVIRPGLVADLEGAA